ncbi:prealbumin-like fold domain-containing protein [Nocardioides mesophilus]|uniref:Prealbumin-like fold domain-containing protein n=1 Tax=Nocardioides mesophilus TaxID=433659 RepID=A0A7G9RFB2_9ACTN|nr:prealbumin-like fold domain-containing protein [Nocardioides mesophilus]QNN54287.1 prealbumin-like fold domain-containing protein [Nocardioides mesophilus]
MVSHTSASPAHRSAWGRVVRILVALCLGLVTLPFLTVSAEAVGPGSIAIDGDQDGLTTDWEGYHVGDDGFSLIRDGVGNGDSTGIDGQERDYDGEAPEKAWTANKATASGKSDVGNVLVSSFRQGGPSGDLIAAVGFDRGNGSGTQRYYLELNQAVHTSIMPTRTVKDLRVILAVNGKDLEECQGAQLWTGSQWGAVQKCAGLISFDVNDAPIEDYFGSPYLTAGKIPTNQFFEVSINLTDLGATSCPVAGFKTFDMRTQEGAENVDTGQLKDVIRGPIDIDSDCGTINIVKKDAATGAAVTVAGAKFSITPDPTAGSTATGAKTVVDNNTSAADLTDTDPRPGYVTVANVDPDTYTVTEVAAPAGYLLPPPGCDSSDDTDRCTTRTVSTGGSVTFSFEDKHRYDAPTILKNAAALYDATYTWDIEKTVADADEVPGPDATQNVPQGTSASFDYAVKVREVARSTSNYRVSGTVTVGNPNKLPMTVTLSDELADGTVCTFPEVDDVSAADGLQVTLGASDAEIPFGYRCSPGDQAQDGTNTATVTWDRSVYPQGQGQVDSPPATPGSATADAGYAFVVDQETDKTVTVTDDHHVFDPAWTNTWGQGANPETRTYTKSFPGIAGTCTDYDNTAAITQTGQSDSATATVCVGKDLAVTKNKIASLTRTYAFDLAKSADDTTLEVDPTTGKATASYTVTVTDRPASDSDWLMKGKIFVSNPNDWQAIILTGITDAYNGDSDSCAVDTSGGLTIAAGAQDVAFPYTCKFDQQPAYGGSNVATVSWDPATASTPTGSASGKAPVAAADWAVSEIDKTVNLVDDKTVPGAVNVLGPVTWKAAGTEHPFTYQLSLNGVPGQCVDYKNVATLVETDQRADETVTVCAPQGVKVTKDGAGTYDRTYAWTIDKQARESSVSVTDGTADFHYGVTVTPAGYVDSGWTMAGTITVENPNDYKTITVDLTDVPATGGGAKCTVTDGTDVVVPMATLSGGKLVPGKVSRPYSCTFDSQPTYDGATNTAIAAWDGGSAASVPTAIPFTVDDETNKVITVTDDMVDLPTSAVLGTADWSEGAKTFTYTLTQEGVSGECTDYTNTAVIAETDQDAQETVTLCKQAPLSVEKDVTATFDRTYLWQIDKVADKHEAEIPADGAAGFHYDVTVGPDTTGGTTGYDDSGWEMSGTITVTNSNSTEVGAITADVTDQTDVGGGARCTVTGGTAVVVEPGEAVELAYTCSFASQPAYTGTNTATAAWIGVDGPESREFVRQVGFVLDDEIQRYVDVEDNQVTLADPATIGEHLDWFDGEQVLGYDLSLGGVAGTCVEWTNLAEIVQTGQTADETVRVCSEAALVLAKDATATFDRTYHWRLDKVAGQLDDVEVTDGDTATFGYTVTATPVVPADGVYDDHGYELGGSIEVTNPNTYEGGSITADVVDVPDLGDAVTCAVVGGDDVLIAPDSTVRLEYACTITGRPDYTGTNVARATWSGPDGAARTASSDPVPVTFTLDGETDKTVTVVDDQTVPGQSVELGSATWNAEGTPGVFTYDLPLTGTVGECTPFTNTATMPLEGSDDLTAGSTVTLCIQGDAVLANVVNASYDRAYAWGIDKVADGTSFGVGDDGTAEVTYTVAATPGAATDSGWEMTGSLMVLNPNDYKSLTLDVSTLTDLGEGVSCALDAGQDLVLPPLGERVLTYTCTFAGQPSYAGTDTTTVDWGSGSVEIQTPVAFGLDQETDRVVDVVDDQTVPGTSVDLGQAEWNEAGTPVTFTYALDLAAEPNECQSYTNTAQIVQTGQADDATVEVCGPEILPEEEVRPRPRPPVVVAGVETVLPGTGGPAGLLAWGGAAMLLTGGMLLLTSTRRGRS